MTAGIKLVHVPYPGSAQALTDVVTGRVQLWIAPASAVIQQVAEGKLKAIAVTTAQRATIAPDVPTMAEAGLPGYDLGLWFGLMAPAGTPAPIVDKLNGMIVPIVNSPAFRTLIENAGSIAESSTPQEFGAIINKTLDDATPTIKEFGLQQD
jgi:tripartite-type tricarboxylate transporter receptor subunit TctC